MYLSEDEVFIVSCHDTSVRRGTRAAKKIDVDGAQPQHWCQPRIRGELGSLMT